MFHCAAQSIQTALLRIVRGLHRCVPVRDFGSSLATSFSMFTVVLSCAVKIAAQDVEDLNQRMIADRIIDLVAHLPVDDDLFGPEDSQVLGRVGLLDPELFNQLSGRQLAIAQQFDNRDPGRICESLKDLTLELPECVAHL